MNQYYGLANKDPAKWNRMCDRVLLVVLMILWPLLFAELSSIPLVTAYLVCGVSYLLAPIIVVGGSWVVLGLFLAVCDGVEGFLKWLGGD